MTALGRPGWRLGAAALDAITNIVAVAIAAPWGILTVAAAISVRAYLVLIPLHIVLMRKLIGFEPARYLRQLVTPLLASALSVLAAWIAKRLLDATSWELLLVVLTCASVGAVTYAAAIAAIDPRLIHRLWRSAAPVAEK